MSESPFEQALRRLEQFFEGESGVGPTGEGEPLEAFRNAVLETSRLAIPDDIAARLRNLAKRLDAVGDGEAKPFVQEALGRLREEAPRLVDRPLTIFKGVGPKRAAQLAERGLRRVADVLFYLPSAYDDRRTLTVLDDLEVGRPATFLATVERASRTTSRGRFRRNLEVVVRDETGTALLKWFRGVEAIEKMLVPGTRLVASGDVRRFRFAKMVIHPEIEILSREDSEEEVDLNAFRRIVPRYAAVSGLSPRGLRRLVSESVSQYSDAVAHRLPGSLVEERKLPGPGQALRAIHAPDQDVDLLGLADQSSPAFQCLVLEELYLLELGLALRQASASRRRGQPIDVDDRRVEGFLGALPFALTAAQERSWGEIRADLARPHPMNRLLQGDVGSGKTAVAYVAARAVAACGHQAAFVAPTELLAEQHLRSFRRLEEGRPREDRLRMALLCSSLPTADAREVRARLVRGEVDLVVGTHALLQEQVAFASLALAVVDEQHRFGVLQRAALLGRGPGDCVPHALVMTATPIPRTLSLTLYGDLDLSVIDALPPGRTPVQSALVREGEGQKILDAIADALGRNEQVFVVYPLVEMSEKSDLRNVVESAERLKRALPDARVDLVHGRLDATQRAQAMHRFEEGTTQVLVATSVVEVGVDVPNATLMVVEHAERFGLAQLHQLRGRVGRGRKPGLCIFVSRGGGEDSEARLAALLATTDGFQIADADLQIRGPGEFLGTRQHGALPDLGVADLLRDSRLVSVAREAAFAAVRLDPGLANDVPLRRAVEARWGRKLSFADVG